MATTFLNILKKKIHAFKDPRKRKVFILRIVNALIRFHRKLFRYSRSMLFRGARKFLTFHSNPLLLSIIGYLARNKLRVRRYLHPNLTIELFFEKLKKRDIRYVVLRWFEHLPEVKNGEDIDLLVHDEDIAAMRDLFSIDPRQQPFDVYSVSGLPGSNYRDTPYYSPHLAEKVLESRTWLNNLYAVPDKHYHFLSLAYHALFHKGKHAGIPNRQFQDFVVPEHDYVQHLKALDPNTAFKNACNYYSKLNDMLKV